MSGGMNQHLSRRLSTPFFGVCLLYLTAISIDRLGLGSLMALSVAAFIVVPSIISVVWLRRISVTNHDDAEWLIGRIGRWLTPALGSFLPVVLLSYFLNPRSGAIAALVATCGLLLSIAIWLAINAIVTRFYELRIASMEAEEDSLD